MQKETTFFSYSRSDSEFVLKLAKDLREAGENLWLDQLDIEAGSRWDASIQAALHAATRMIIVLSPDSVSSNNVMDEVSFALEAGKTVIPVMLIECEPPFRLRRLQRIDFTGDYQKALQKLLIAVEPNAETSKVETRHDGVVQTTLQPERETSYSKTSQAASRTADMENENASSSGNSKKLLWIGGVIVLIAISIWAVTRGDKNEPIGHDDEDESIVWNKALAQNDSISYAHYLEHFPAGDFSDEAKHKIDSITNASRLAMAKRDSIDYANKLKENNEPDENSPPQEDPKYVPRHPLKKTPFYAIMVSSAKTQKEAIQKTMQLKRSGNEADYLWIPDYASLSGSEFYTIYIGPYSTQKECEIMTDKVRKKFSNAYGLLVSQEKKRVQIYGVGRVRESVIK